MVKSLSSKVGWFVLGAMIAFSSSCSSIEEADYRKKEDLPLPALEKNSPGFQYLNSDYLEMC